AELHQALSKVEVLDRERLVRLGLATPRRLPTQGAPSLDQQLLHLLLDGEHAPSLRSGKTTPVLASPACTGCGPASTRTEEPMPETRIDEIADGIYRVHTAIPPEVAPGGFSFNQYLVVDEAPLLFHTGSRRLFPGVRQAIERV